MNRHAAVRRGPVLEDALLQSVREQVLQHDGPVTAARIAAAVQASGKLLGAEGSLAAVTQISAELHGLGPLQGLAEDPGVTDIFVNAPHSVWIDAGCGPVRAAVSFQNEAQVRTLAIRLVAACGRRLDDSSPCADVRLAGGLRVHAVLPPISPTGTLISIRIRRTDAFTLDEWLGASSDQMLGSVLRSIIQCRLNFLISGSTGSGKTTLLSTLLGMCSPEDRLVLIEDAAELAPKHPHVLTLESRHPNAEGSGEVGLSELVRQALRMNPSRLVVGECRGAEVRDLLTALNTGHRGGGGTIHANSASDVPARLAALGALAGLSRDSTNLQAVSALDVVVHLERTEQGRRVADIAVPRYKGGELSMISAIRPHAALSMDTHTVPGAGDTGTTMDAPAEEKTVSYGPGWQQLRALLEKPGAR
jgi:pilus assembly protein CpaF